jgi:hypothetical protein
VQLFYFLLISLLPMVFGWVKEFKLFVLKNDRLSKFISGHDWVYRESADIKSLYSLTLTLLLFIIQCIFTA